MLPHLIIYTELKNAAAIQENFTSNIAITSGQQDQRMVVVDLSLVVSEFHLQLAIFKAILNESQGRMKTKSITAEVLYQLSPSTKINDAIKQYSIHPESTAIAFINIPPAENLDSSSKNSSGVEDAPTNITDNLFSIEEFKDQITKLAVDGIESSAAEISSLSILTHEKSTNIIKCFKIAPLELEISGLEDCVATRLAVKDLS
jgi:EKC/KEOPS complex subunit CGI121/TPRKB